MDLSFTNAMIEINSEVTLGITWSPVEAGSWREVLQLTDGRRVKYEISLVMQAQDLRKKDSKTRPKVRKPLISKSNITQQSYQPKIPVVHQKESSLDKKQIEPRSKRTRIDSYLDEPDKENITENVEHVNESSIMKKQRKEILNATSIISTDAFVLTPVKFNNEKSKKQNQVKFAKVSQNAKYSNKEYNFSPQESFIVMEERIEMKTLRRETYVKTPKYREMITIDEQDEVFDDSLSPSKEKSDFSRLIDNINFTPKLPSTPEGVFEFSPRACSTGSKSDSSKLSDSESKTNTTFEITKEEEIKESERVVCLPPSPIKKPSSFLKPTRLTKNFEALTPITPAPQRKVEFASSSLLSLDCTNIETPRRFGNTSYRDLDSSTVKEILEADMWVKPENIFPIRRERREKEKEILDNTFDLTVPKISALEITPPKSFNRKKVDPKNCLLEISPPKLSTKSHRRFKLSSPGKRPLDNMKRISPTKSGKIVKNHETSMKKKQLGNSFKNSIPGVKIANLSLSGITRKKVNQSLSILKENSVKLHDPNDFVRKFCNPDPFAATMTEDPFLSSTLYYDEKWVHHQEMEFRKWLNALMTPPEHLNTDIDTNCVDIGKLWQSSRMQGDVVLAESKESISARIHTDTRLNTLRKAACMMFRNPEVSNILSRTTVCVEKGILVMRQDRDLHRDIGLQKGILELFLSYNPLWLRIGLETVYGETIPLRSNNDLIGLTRFLFVRFFSDEFMTKQHSHPTVVGMKLPTFTPSMNKFMLKKFLLLVFFLDFAKCNKLIGHDPCLFHKKAPHKDSRSILLTFSRELLSGIGDITKVLKSYGYIVSYKQTFLDEFDYAVKDMSTDLRDGVRLCRAMELITGNRNLTCQCRVPAISRLQKIHNVNIALKALLDSNYIITGEIDAKNISDGHREKTLSLLWQIIYKFQKPRFEKAALTLQIWWRSKLWYVRIKNLVRNHKSNAACVIQRAWRCFTSRKVLKNLKIEHKMKMTLINNAASVIQNRWRLQKEAKNQRNQFLEKRKAALKIQTFWRKIRETKPFIQNYQKQRAAVILFQRTWRSKKLMETTRGDFLKLREATTRMQIRFRAKLIGRSERRELENLKNASLVIQRRFRALKLMKTHRESYQKLLKSAKIVQNWWRGVLILKRDRNAFLLKKYAVRVFEKKWIEKKTITDDRRNYLEKRQSAIIIQRSWRKYQATNSQVSQFQAQRRSALKIQSFWRSWKVRREYKKIKNSCKTIHNWWRSLQVAKKCQIEYSRKKTAVLILQKNWRMTLMKRNYWQMKSSVLVIESWYENLLLSRAIRDNYLQMKKGVQTIENWWLNLKIAKKEREKYLKVRSKIIDIQRKWRSKKLTEETKRDFQVKKSAAVKIQSHFRMYQQRKKYQILVKRLNATIVIQRKWRATLLQRKAENNYRNLRKSAILLQNKWRARKLAKLTQNEYLQKREKIIKIQTQWRFYSARKSFERKREAAIKIQNWWRHKKAGHKIREEYLKSKNITIYLQRRVRRNQKTKKTRENYLELKNAALVIQRKWKARIIGRKIRGELEKYKKSAIFVQSTWRMKIERRKYEKTRETILKMQTIWRAKLLARETRKYYSNLKLSTLVIQRRWREVRLGNEIRRQFLYYRKAVIVIQSAWRMKIAVKKYKNLINASLVIQSHWRAKIEGRRCRENFHSLKTAAVLVQRRYKANKLCQIEKRKYSILRKSIILIQRKWRAEIEARKLSYEFSRQKESAIKIQNCWRSIRKMRECRNDYLKSRELIIKLQRRYRGNILAREARGEYEELRNAVLKVQSCWRFILAKRKMRELLVRRKIAVGVIENWWLKVLVMKKIEDDKRAEMRRLNFAATKIQALWRGFRVRNANTARMSELRIRTKNAAREAIPAQTLANRLEDSINVFLFSNDLGRLSMCLSSLGENIFSFFNFVKIVTFNN